MRSREKLTLEEKVALALDLIKRERTLEEIRAHYRVSHTTAYKVRNMFLEGGRAALSREHTERRGHDLEERVSALEHLLRAAAGGVDGRPLRAGRALHGNGAVGR
jgi:RNase adaptor protein for sRNA GlmZ degradation